MSDLRRVGPGDALIGLSLLALVFAVLLPTFRARAFDSLVEDASSDVDALREAALRQLQVNGGWPPSMEPGAIPIGVSGAFRGENAMVRDEYTLQWRLWDRVEYVQAPPPRSSGVRVVDDDEAPVDVSSVVAGDLPPDTASTELVPVVREAGAVIIHSSNAPLLAQLLARYGPDASFVRDSTWMLVVERPR